MAKPINGRKSENRYWPGTIVRFACDEGYRLIGYEVRRCREDGLWSWGVDPQCIKQVTYSLLLSAIFIGIAIPVIILIILVIICCKRERKLKKQQLSPPKLPPKSYKLNQNLENFKNDEITAPIVAKEASLKSLNSSKISSSRDFSDDEEGFGITRELESRQYSSSFGPTKADINPVLTSSRSITLV